jgi:hypothetical protein
MYLRGRRASYAVQVVSEAQVLQQIGINLSSGNVVGAVDGISDPDCKMPEGILDHETLLRPGGRIGQEQLNVRRSLSVEPRQGFVDANDALAILDTQARDWDRGNYALVERESRDAGDIRATTKVSLGAQHFLCPPRVSKQVCNDLAHVRGVCRDLSQAQPGEHGGVFSFVAADSLEQDRRHANGEGLCWSHAASLCNQQIGSAHVGHQVRVGKQSTYSQNYGSW